MELGGARWLHSGRGAKRQELKRQAKRIDYKNKLTKMMITSCHNYTSHLMSPLLMLLLLLGTFAEGSSQLRGTWLMGQEDEAARRTNEFVRSAPGQRTRLDELPLSAESRRQLQAAASSLQPAIAELTAEERPRANEQQPRFKLAHVPANFSHAAASSLDHLWSQTGPLNWTNAQVHFDEDHLTPGAHQLASVRPALVSNASNDESPSSNQNSRIGMPAQELLHNSNWTDFKRRQDNETSLLLSNLAPLHEDYLSLPAEDDELERELAHKRRRRRRPHLELNRSSIAGQESPATRYEFLDLGQQHNQTQTFNQTLQSHHNSNESEPLRRFELPASGSLEPPAGLYYLPHGDKWNLQPVNFDQPTRGEDENELHPHSPTNWKRELEQQQQWRRRRRLQTANEEANYLRDFESERLQLNQVGQGAPRQLNFAPTTSVPPLDFQPATSAKQQHYSTSLASPLHFGAPPSSFLNLVPLNEIPQQRLQVPIISRRAPANKVVLRPSASQHKSSLRSYKPMQLGLQVGKQNKKSLISALNQKLNSWTGENQQQQQQQPNVAKMIEQSFFGAPPHRSVHWNASPAPSFMVLPQATGADTSTAPGLFFGPGAPIVRQPTVAPAASTLNRFYGHAGYSGASNRRPATQVSGLIQHQGSQQPASFIPVVAVQVTRTSPAPTVGKRAPQPATEAQFVSAYEELPTDGEPTSASQIDDYLANKMGQQQRQRQANLPASNLNERQKWDDSAPSSKNMITNHQQPARLSNWQRTRQPSAAFYQQLADEQQQQQQQQQQAAGMMARNQQHETTIRSAVFGYLPQQADAPLLQAMQVLQQLPVGASERHQQNVNHPNSFAPSAGQQHELYANQMDRSNQAVDAATPIFEHHAYPASGLGVAGPQFADEEATGGQQPSLALQLQAHNYVQNDIAHPFAAGQLDHSRAKSLDVYANDQPLQFLHQQAAQLAQPSASYTTWPTRTQRQQQQQQYPFVHNPLLEKTPPLPTTLQHQLASLGQAEQQLLLNPMLATPLLYPSPAASSPTGALEQSFYELIKLASTENQAAHNDGAANSQSGSSAVADDATTAANQQAEVFEQSVQKVNPKQRGQQLGQNQGKKRSSEFFASAGQLLLSALPLLLAPTLGLMFASSPSPIARFHAPNPLGPASSGGGASLSHYAAGNSQQMAQAGGGQQLDGLVLNASPTPQLFTPTPQDGAGGGNQAYSLNDHQQYLDQAELSAEQHRQLNERRAANASLAPSGRPTSNNLYKPNNVTASLPALTGLQMNQAAARTKGHKGAAHNKSTSTARPMTIILTTLASTSAQSPPGSANFTAADLSSLASGQIAHSKLHNSSTLAPAILVLEDDDDADSLAPPLGESDRRSSFAYNVSLANSSASNFHSTADDELTTGTSTRATTSAPVKSTPLYDVGYEGADFDAQFATLRRQQQRNESSELLATVRPQRHTKDKNQYQYAEVTGGNGGVDHERHPWATSALLAVSGGGASPDEGARNQSHEPAELSSEDSAQQLYPMSTWPKLRRRTVSLITSQGNRTLPDSSQRYQMEQDNRPPSRRQQSPARRNKLTSDANEQIHFVHAPSAQVEVGKRRRPAVLSANSDSFLVELAQDRVNQLEDRRLGERQLREKREIPTAELANFSQPEGQKKEKKNKKRTSSQASKLAKRRGSKAAGATLDADRQLNGGPKVAINSTASNNSLEVAANSLHLANRQTANDGETLRRDASRRKSAIVTAMITHGEPDDDQDESLQEGEEERELRSGGNSLLRLLRHRAVGGVDEPAGQLRAQLLAKKMLLDRLATRASASSLPDEAAAEAAAAEAELENLELVGRAHMRPLPTSEEAGERRTPARTRRRNAPNSIELNDATKKALAKFGSLLLEDTLQVPGDTGERRRSANRERYASSAAESLGSATERYATRAVTQAPPSAYDNWSRPYEPSKPTANNWTSESSYGQPPARTPTRLQHGQHNSSSYESAAYEQPPTRARQPVRDPYGSRSPPSPLPPPPPPPPPPSGDTISRYNDFLLNNFQENRPHGSATAAAPDQQPQLNSSSTDQLDARHSTYSNYSTAPPALHQTQDSAAYPNTGPGYHAYSGAGGRGREPPDYHTDPSYQQHHHPAVQNYSSSYWPPAPPLPPRSQYARPAHSDGEYSGHYPPPPPPPSEQHEPAASYSPPRPGWPGYSRYPPTAGYSAQAHQPLGPASEQPPVGYHPNAHTPHHHHHHHHHQQPHQQHQHPLTSSTYAPASSTSYEPTTRASDTKAVNEYLKRVQFSDSDRDKLMASYLTCDGLLNDHDHCLERLSCEFSDPQNIERANKLDRAVSSILLGHILINTYIPNSFKLRLKSASLFGYTQSGKCSKFVCSKLTARSSQLGLQND